MVLKRKWVETNCTAWQIFIMHAAMTRTPLKHTPPISNLWKMCKSRNKKSHSNVINRRWTEVYQTPTWVSVPVSMSSGKEIGRGLGLSTGSAHKDKTCRSSLITKWELLALYACDQTQVFLWNIVLCWLSVSIVYRIVSFGDTLAFHCFHITRENYFPEKLV